MSQSYVQVALEQGELRGTIEKTDSATLYLSFKGIPYAVPPVGKLRFSAPVPHKKWEGILDASQHGNVCPQWDTTTGEIISSSEDCLFLNVYVPFSCISEYPVMVWFHGGAFQFGSGDSSLYGPDYLIDEGVIMVTVNYRLEVLGFLCLETEEVPGNAGMKDQVLALKWVKNNIAKFGGDPNNVTIFGESAGAAACTYHLISPMSRGLFHKVIAQSGCCFNEWSRSFGNVDRAFRLGKFLGKDTNDKTELLSYLRSLPVERLIKVTFSMRTEGEKFRGLPIIFTPVKEKCYKGRESFLPKTAKKCIAENDFAHVPILIGYNNKEGINNLKFILRKAKAAPYDFTRRVPKDIIYKTSPYVISHLGEQIKNFYFDDKTVGEDTLYETIAMDSDYNVVYGVQKFAKHVAQISTCPVYLYRFSVDGKLNFAKHCTQYKHLQGASHGDALCYLFKTFLNVEDGSFEQKTIKRMTKMWTNFAKYGDPTPHVDPLVPVKWKPITPTRTNVLDFGSELICGIDPDIERYQFWTSLYEQVQQYKRLMKSRL